MSKKKKEEEIVTNEEITEDTSAPEEEIPTEEVDAEISEEDEKDKEIKALNDKYLRVVAEYDNYRKRTAKEKESIYPEAKVAVVAAMLPVMDNLERALNAAKAEDPLYEGVKMTLKQFEDAFKGIGVEEIKAVGEQFDPKFHNAVMHVEDENLGENIIAEEFQKGYKLGDRIIRYSMVKVAN